CMARDAGMKVTIASSDKDLMQLVEPDGSIRLLDTIPRPGQPPLRWIGPDEVMTKFGVTPDKVVDVQALCGDSVDNVPGVPGIGVKTAAELINTYGTLENLLEHATDIKQNARREKLNADAQLARISKKLVTLERQVPVEIDLDGLVRQPMSPSTLFPFLKAMEFATITKRLAALLEANPDDFEPDPELKAGGTTDVGAPKKSTTLSVAKAKLAANVVPGSGPARFAAEEHARVKAIPVNHDAYEIVTTPDRLEAWIAKIFDKGHVAVDTETTSLDPQVADIVGVCLSTEMGTGCYIPVGHQKPGDLLDGGGLVEGQLPIGYVLEALKRVLEAPSILKIGQ